MQRLLGNIEESLEPGESREPWHYHSLRLERAKGEPEPTTRWILLRFLDHLRKKGVDYPLSRMPRRPTAWDLASPRRHFRLKEGILRPDQRDAVTAAMRNLSAGKRGGYMLMPPGWGKTWVALSIAGGMGQPCAFLMQSTELLVQFMLSLFRDFNLLPELHLKVGAVISEDKAKELGEFQRHIDFGTAAGGFGEGVRLLFVSATALRHLRETRSHQLETIRGRFPSLFVDEAHQVAPSHEGDEDSSMLIQSIEELVTPSASVLAFTQGFDRQDGFVAYLNTMFRWCPEVRERGGVLYRAYHYEVGRVNFTLHRIAVEASSRYTDDVRRELHRQARQSPASTDYLEKLSWQLEANRMAAVFATVARHRAAGRTVMVFLDYRSAVYAYAEMTLVEGSNVVVMTGSPSEDRQQVAGILQRIHPAATPAQIQEGVQHHTVTTRERLKVRARKAGRTSAHRSEGELPLLMLVTKAASVGLDIVEVSSAVVVSSCDAARQRLQQIAGRCGRAVGELRDESRQLLRDADRDKSSLVTLLHCPREDYVVHDAQHTESHRESFFHDQIWESLRVTFGHCRCGRERQACPECATLCRGCEGRHPVAASMPHTMLCRACLGDGYREAAADVCYFPTRVMEVMEDDSEASDDDRGNFASRLASPTFAPGEVPATVEDAKRSLRPGPEVDQKAAADSGKWHDPSRVEGALAAGMAWLCRMEAVYDTCVVRRNHVARAGQ